eukprot:gnl/TRDRNA2_/TRDRNA2_92555_c1_seq2.p1 gnl/TRDRNA2_/TRDRNA2_92555_c1~~gnl/TRDRNA2_/TRDRNA2_92555_c1_seq2.p1  ORF type:complete len:209 (+),score=39.52 gnl/TRDRNA2_/TRDRNA2_92555_c1_seq2:38-664(+)
MKAHAEEDQVHVQGPSCGESGEESQRFSPSDLARLSEKQADLHEATLEEVRRHTHTEFGRELRYLKQLVAKMEEMWLQEAPPNVTELPPLCGSQAHLQDTPVATAEDSRGGAVKEEKTALDSRLSGSSSAARNRSSWSPFPTDAPSQQGGVPQNVSANISYEVPEGSGLVVRNTFLTFEDEPSANSEDALTGSRLAASRQNAGHGTTF